MEKYVLITGASSGIGYAYSEYYAKQHRNLIIVARSTEKLQTMKENWESKYGIKVKVIVSDLGKEYGPKKIYEEVREADLFVEILINCAGFATRGDVNSTDFSKQHDQIMVNVLAVFDLTKLFLSSMIKKNTGTIINVASTAGYHPIPTMSVYAATKAFVVSFTEALALEVTDKNIKILAISPGATATNFFSNGGGVAVGNMRQPEDVVNVSFKALEQGKISKIDGKGNYFTSMILPRILSRKRMVKLVATIMNRQ